jgi:hypothetical protein
MSNPSRIVLSAAAPVNFRSAKHRFQATAARALPLPYSQAMQQRPNRREHFATRALLITTGCDSATTGTVVTVVVGP